MSSENPRKPATPTSNNVSNSPARIQTELRERALPHDIAAERALLGAMLLDEAAIGEAIQVLGDAGVDCFFLPKNQTLYKHILALYDQRKPMDGIVIKDELVRQGVFDELGGFDFLAGLASSVPSASRAAEYARIVREKYLLRALIAATHQVMDVAYDDAQRSEDIFDYAEKAVFEVTERRVESGMRALPELLDEMLEKLKERNVHALRGVETGFYELDDLTCGLQPSELIIIAGRPSMGKTAFGLNVAEHVTITDNQPALFFSLEMSAQQVMQRILSSRARVSSHHMRRGMLAEEDFQRLDTAATDLHGRPLLIDDTSNITILELRARARMAFRRHQIKIIFVDYLQLLRAPGYNSRQEEVAAISRGLKALAKELGVPVVAMAQLNRGPEDRTGNRPRMSDLRESGAIEQDADLIALLHREAYYRQDDSDPDQENMAELIIAKQRNGPVGTVELHFNRQWTRFDNHHPGPEPAQVPAGSDFAPF